MTTWRVSSILADVWWSQADRSRSIIRNRLVLFLLLAFVGVAIGPRQSEAALPGKMYWTELGDGVHRANLDGSDSELLFSASSFAIALDPVGRKIYWNDGFAATEGIWRANLDGTGAEFVVGEDSVIIGIAVDAQAGKLYWTASSDIHRANLDGTSVEHLVNTTDLAGLIELDSSAGKMYWTRQGIVRASIFIQKANLDGSDVETFFSDPGDPVGLAVDTQGEKVYWTEFNERKVRRANSDSTNVEDLFTGESPSELYDVVLDRRRGTMYWVDSGAEEIWRSKLDGNAAEKVLSTGSMPRGIALDLPGVGGIAELPFAAGTAARASGSSGHSAGLLAIIGVVAAGALALGGAAWRARRRAA